MVLEAYSGALIAPAQPTKPSWQMGRQKAHRCIDRVITYTAVE
jgi:hypothetical protein